MEVVDNSSLGRIYQAAMQLFAEKGTQTISVSELAGRAGVARGTIYNNMTSLDNLFEDVASRLANQLAEAIVPLIETYDDPAERIAYGMKYALKHAHDDPSWALFLIRFGISNSSLRGFWEGSMAEDLGKGVEQERFKIARDQIPTIIAMVTCSVLGGFHLVREGFQTWKNVAENVVELNLRALGVP